VLIVGEALKGGLERLVACSVPADTRAVASAVSAA
jgi:hypothetical protein